MAGYIAQIVEESFKRFADNTANFLPHLAGAVIILLIGAAASWLALKGFREIFRLIRLDNYAEKTGVAGTLRGAGIRDTCSGIAARLISWLLMVLFAIIALDSLGLPSISDLTGKLVLYIPQVFVALIILYIGYLAGNFLSRAALIAAVNAKSGMAKPISKTIKYAVIALSGTMALEQLGIGSGTVIVAFALVFGGVLLSLAISFGFGGRDLARQYLEKKIAGEKPGPKAQIRHI